ncbi:unnamed protein product [Allacma fusca]|uniref:Uncharacterized protein n=1 Tax=Allacma fusca TaxID=39272 RepID=A0A8J2PN59_9HEXA|nr:unnamed protein product [Allacma fusca]
MELRFGVILYFLTFTTLSLACHSMNGISKKAILHTLENTRKSQERRVSSEENSEELEEIGFLSEEDRILNEVLQYKTVKNSDMGKPLVSNTILHTIFSKKNTTKQYTAESLTSNYIGFKFINTNSSSSNNGSGVNPGKIHPKFLALRLLHEPALSVNEPGMKTERNSEKPYTTVLSMKPPLNSINSPPVPTTEQEENDKINSDWGGECGLEDWKKCYNITVVGNPTEVHPQFPHDKKKNRQTQMDCFDTMEAIDFPWLCLRNGWTVNRCHILCMSMCNRELLMTRKWEFYVLHEGPCKTK